MKKKGSRLWAAVAAAAVIGVIGVVVSRIRK